MKELSVRTSRHEEFVDVTSLVEQATRGWRCSAVLVYVPHTTAGVFVNEHADPDVVRDIGTALERMVPAGASFRHIEGNAPAHVKAVIVGSSQVVPVTDGRLGLGTWQGIFLAEFDGPRNRRLVVVPLGDALSDGRAGG
jgi:secondary thiamine-phosphate synthase enzyme